MSPTLRHVCDLNRKICDSKRYVDVALHDWYGDFYGIVESFVVDEGGSVGTSAGEDVDAQPEADFVFCPGVIICPVVEFVPDPG